MALHVGDHVTTTIRIGPPNRTALRVLDGTYLGLTERGTYRVLTADGEVTVHPTRVTGRAFHGAREGVVRVR